MDRLSDCITYDFTECDFQILEEDPEEACKKRCDFMGKLFSGSEDILALAYNESGEIAHLPFPSDQHSFDSDENWTKAYTEGHEWTDLKFIQKGELTQEELDVLHCCCVDNLFHEFGSRITLNKNVTQAEMISWAKVSWWSEWEAISRTVSCRHSDIESMKLEALSIRKKIEQGKFNSYVNILKNQNGLFVRSYDWLRWCKAERLEIPDLLWDSVSRQDIFQKLEILHIQNTGINITDIDRIFELDETLHQCKLLDECHSHLSFLNQNGWNPGEANKICNAIIQKGILLRKISEIKSAPPLHADVDIKKIHESINEIDKFLNGQGLEQPNDTLSIFKTMANLTWGELTICLLRKDEKSIPDRVRIEARNTQRTVSCNALNLINKKNGLLNRAGTTLLAMSKKTTPKNLKATARAMTDLRKTFLNLNIKDKEPFIKTSTRWMPKFTLVDAIKKADKRAANRAVHFQFDDTHPFDQENDNTGEWLLKNDI